MKTFIISDMHFGHKNIIKYENRPFASVGEMDDLIIQKWNNSVKNGDIVFVLGDVSFYNQEKTKEIISSLNGRKFLIMGNHDYKWKETAWRKIGFECVYRYPIIIDQFFILSHEPVYLNDNMPYRNIHGHIHSKRMDNKCYVNASVECINYYPVNIVAIKNYFHDIMIPVFRKNSFEEIGD